MKLQEKQTEIIKQVQEEQTRAIEANIETKKAITAPKTDSIDGSEASEKEENVSTKAIDSATSDTISSLLNQANTHNQTEFIKENFNNY